MESIRNVLEIGTERLVLRPYRLSDAVRLVDLISDPCVTRMLSRVPYPYDLQDATAFIGGLLDAPGKPARNFAVTHREFGLIGGLGLHFAEDPWPELGYWLGRTFWGRGFATEAATAAVHWAESSWKGRAILSGHFADNPASARVLEKIGFLYTGEVRLRFSSARACDAPTRMMVRLA